MRVRAGRPIRLRFSRETKSIGYTQGREPSSMLAHTVTEAVKFHSLPSASSKIRKAGAKIQS